MLYFSLLISHYYYKGSISNYYFQTLKPTSIYKLWILLNLVDAKVQLLPVTKCGVVIHEYIATTKLYIWESKKKKKKKLELG